MKRFLIGVLCSIGVSATANAASPDDQLTAPIRQFVDSFNKGDVNAAAAAHAAADLAIVDEVAPYLWRGPGAFRAWNDALTRDAQARGVSDPKVTLGAPTRQEQSGDRAYVVVPAVYTYKQRAVAMREPAVMAFSLQKDAGGWRISGWTWAGETPQPAAAPGR